MAIYLILHGAFSLRPFGRLVPWRDGNTSLVARFMGPTWGPSVADRTQVGPMLAPWTLLSGTVSLHASQQLSYFHELLKSVILHLRNKCDNLRLSCWLCETNNSKVLFVIEIDGIKFKWIGVFMLGITALETTAGKLFVEKLYHSFFIILSDIP